MIKQVTRLNMALGTPSDNFYRAEMGVHFSRVGDGFIPDATTTEEANVFMCRGLEMGTVNQNYISTLDSLLEHVCNFFFTILHVFPLNSCVLFNKPF